MSDPLGTALAEDDEATLARLLASLGSPTRLALLRQLRSPRTLGEIRLKPEQTRPGQNPDRPMTRQAVRAHLDWLLESGFVRTRDAHRGPLPVEEYLVNHQRLFALAEELRQLGGLRPTDHTWDGATAPLVGAPGSERLLGPRLVVVHGLGEGRTFPLAMTDGAESAGWTIGRRWGLPVTLDYDPFVSSEHARIVKAGASFLVEDLPASRNGTTLNWTLIPKGERAELAHGDVVGVGRSLLLFRT